MALQGTSPFVDTMERTFRLTSHSRMCHVWVVWAAPSLQLISVPKIWNRDSVSVLMLTSCAPLPTLKRLPSPWARGRRVQKTNDARFLLKEQSGALRPAGVWAGVRMTPHGLTPKHGFMAELANEQRTPSPPPGPE